jgi:uncharacterized protein (TIGR01319 family)
MVSPDISKDTLNTVLATDCGSTTTKAVLFQKTDAGWRQTARGEAPTTVEKPVADVTIGAINAFTELEELSGRKIIDRSGTANGSPFLKNSGNDGIDLYVSTSSAGGGLQMIVSGAVANMSMQSAERAALGAGAIVLDSFCFDEDRDLHSKVKRIRHLRPDIVLIAGGTEGGNAALPLELAELILQADPRPRFGNTLRMPVIYAANSTVAEDAKKILESRFQFVPVGNVRPTLENENLSPARVAIHDLFLHHVMSHAPGYDKLLSWSPVPIIPTPAAFGQMIETAARRLNKSILAVDIGGATTDVFSALRHPAPADGADQWIFNRSVSANLGMSYSIANVLLEAGVNAIKKWLPFDITEGDLSDRLRNKMIRPSSIPFTREDILIEHAVCREALRMSLDQHRRLAVGLSGQKKSRNIGDIFRREKEDLFDMRTVDLIIGSGGVLSHAPSRGSAALMMIDAYQPTAVTQLAVDSIFMMPHLGTFSQVHEEAAVEILMRDCLVPLGAVIAPFGSYRDGAECLAVHGLASGEIRLKWGDLRLIEFPAAELRTVKLVPLNKRVDIGNGPGVPLEVELMGGVVGAIFDCRGRPLRSLGAKQVSEWLKILSG